MQRDRKQLQRTTLERIKKINELQKDELVDIVLRLTNDAVSIIKDRNGNVEDDIADTLTTLLQETGFGEFKRLFVQEELMGVTRNTTNALIEKDILEESEPFGFNGATYFKWTGKENV